jgi:hypothetical protein
MNAANWVGDKIPGAADNVILDNNNVAANYTVVLPAGNISVTLRSLTISPGVNKNIEVIIPSTNTAIPAFNATGQGYSLVINNGGIFRDASGATAGGAPVELEDSLRINNGGRFVHSTPRSHASIAMVLSRMPGTEKGVFEFDIPGTATFTPSISGRTYGTLILSSTAGGGTRNYTSTGSQHVTMRGDLIIGSGVNYSISFSGSFIIRGNYIQQGGMFNLSSQGDNALMLIAGDMVQQAGIITETSTGFPIIELNGNVPQKILAQGLISNSVSLRINNSAGTLLQSSLSIPYRLELLKGIITTSNSNLLILKTGSFLFRDL